jgi:predicted 3-demethylubiquinone-9 3-methyltransferase (glyoxalase superfamily)
MSKISPCLCFNTQAEEAARFYVSLFPDASVGTVSHYGPNMPMPEGTVLLVDFTLAGQSFQALNAGAAFTFTEAISMSVNCADQVEVDHYWHGLIAGGGAEVQCGWLKDKFGVSWQIVPNVMVDIMTRTDKAAVSRAMAAMMQMRKLDAAALEAAYAGNAI